MWPLLHRCFTSLFYPFVLVQHTIVQMDFRWKEDHPITLLNKELAEFDVVKVEMKSKNVTYISGWSSQSNTLNPLCASHQEELSVIHTQFDATNVFRLCSMHYIHLLLVEIQTSAGCPACVVATWRLGLRAPLVARKYDVP